MPMRRILRPVLLLLLLLILDPTGKSAQAVTIDDFSTPFPAPGTVVTSPTGVGTASQTALPGVLGGARDTRVVADVPTSMTGATILANSNPPPITDIVGVVIGGGGGLLELTYPSLSAYDVTLGGSGPGPSSMIVVRSTLMVADATLRVTLEDIAGIVSSHELKTVDFTGTGDHSYLFSVDASTFGAAGLQLDQVDALRVELSATVGQDAEISDLSIVPMSPKTTNWKQTFAFQAAGGLATPAFLISFQPPPTPPTFSSLSVDMTDPKQPSIVLTGHPPDPILDFSFAPYGGFASLRSTVVDGNHFEFGFEDEGAAYRVVVDVSSSTGLQFDPGGLVGFNPQPEPPHPASIVGFNPQPEPPLPGQAVGFEISTQSAGGDAETISLAFQIFDEADQPVELAYVGMQNVPGLSDWGILVLVIAFGAVAIRSIEWRFG